MSLARKLSNKSNLTIITTKKKGGGRRSLLLGLEPEMFHYPKGFVMFRKVRRGGAWGLA